MQPELKFNLITDPDGILSGRLLDQKNQRPAAGATLTISPMKSNRKATVKLDKKGRFSFSVPSSWRRQAEEDLRLRAEFGGAVASTRIAVCGLMPRQPAPLRLWNDKNEVDSPMAAYASLGLTPWHLGHQATMIQAFHRWLKKQQITPKDLLSETELAVPKKLEQILLEPEWIDQKLLRRQIAEQGWTWSLVKEGTTMRAGDGPRFSLPLTVEQGGLYRLWVRFKIKKGAIAPTSLQIFPRGTEKDAPLVRDEFNTAPATADGMVWHDLLVDLPHGAYTLVLHPIPHLGPSWHAPEGTPRIPRMVDCIFLTRKLWAKPPTADVRAVWRQEKATDRASLWRNWSPLDPEQMTRWQWWQVRPLNWETARLSQKELKNEGKKEQAAIKKRNRLFALSYQFWREQVNRLARLNYRGSDPRAKGVPDYRDPQRQLIFDETWNMVGNPHFIRRQSNALLRDLDAGATEYNWFYLYPGTFSSVTGQWRRSGLALKADPAARHGKAEEDLALPHAGDWQVWVYFKNINYQEYFGITASEPGGNSITWERDRRWYPQGINKTRVWQKVGTISLKKSGKLHLNIWLNGYRDPRTYRGVYAVFVTDNAKYQPRGQVLPPLSRTQYLARARKLGAKKNDRFLVQKAVDVSPANQNWWPGLEPRADSDGFYSQTWDNCGSAGQAPHLVTGKSWQITEKEKKKESIPNAALRTFAYNEKAVVCRYTNLRAERRYQVRLTFFNVKFKRTIAIRFNDKVVVNHLPLPLGKVVERTIDVPPDTLHNGQLEVRVERVEGPSAILSAIQLRVDQRTPDLEMAKDSVRSAQLRFRSLSRSPVFLKVQSALPTDKGIFPGNVQWRVVAFTPTGESRAEWTPFFLLRRPYLVVPPMNMAQIWLSFDSHGVAPGRYRCPITLTDSRGKARTIVFRLRVSPVTIAPQQPVLLWGYTHPPVGQAYLRDAVATV